MDEWMDVWIEIINGCKDRGVDVDVDGFFM